MDGTQPAGTVAALTGPAFTRHRLRMIALASASVGSGVLALVLDRDALGGPSTALLALGAPLVALIVGIVTPVSGRARLPLAAALVAAYATGATVVTVAAGPTASAWCWMASEVALVGLVSLAVVTPESRVERLLEGLRDIASRRAGARDLDEAGAVVAAEFARARRYSRPLAVVLLDVEGARRVRHEGLDAREDRIVTDQIIAAGLGGVVGRELRRNDLLIDHQRRGYLVVSPETGREGVVRMVERIDDAVRHELGLELRCGIAVFPEDGLTFEDLLDEADRNARGETGATISPFRTADGEEVTAGAPDQPVDGATGAGELGA